MELLPLALSLLISASTLLSPALPLAAASAGPGTAQDTEIVVSDSSAIRPSSGEGEPVTYPASLPVLMYHHVVPDGAACNDACITVSRLEQDFRWLNENGYHTVLPRELAAGQPLPEKAVLITFDDGYRSNYDLAYPLLQKYQIKAAIAIIVYMQDLWANSFLTWDMCREMDASGLVEIGSHGYAIHNLDGRNGVPVSGQANGVERKEGESGAAFKSRVLDDLRKSYDRIYAEVGTAPAYFAYPFGKTDPGADAFLKTLFPVTAVTAAGKTPADLSRGLWKLNRFNMAMNVTPSRFC